MERLAWTDERLDDLSRRVDAGFERVDLDMRKLRGVIEALRTTLLRIGGALMVGLIGVIAAVITTG